MGRETVFICHATPNDNDFVRWLGNRLVGHGYEVWADLFELKGGSPFWSSIEEVLRDRVVKVLFVVSRHSVDRNRSGVRNELSVADGLRKSLKDPEFIIPLRIDDTPFDQLPIQVHQQNVLDFSKGWGASLRELLDTLEASKVPRPTIDPSNAFAMWRAISDVPKTRVEHRTEPVLTNLSPIVGLPQVVHLFEFVGDSRKIDGALRDTGIPHSRFLRLIVTLSSMDELQAALPPQFVLQHHSSVPFTDFLDGPKVGETRPLKSDAHNMMTSLLRQHVELHLLSRGLLKYETSQAPAFYFPVGLLEGGKVWYRAANGNRTWKALVGRSERLRVNWHLAMKVNVSVRPPFVVRFKPYICFSEDGQKAIDDPKRTSKLRRSFCRNWWNDQWRQLQMAFNAYLLGEAAGIEIAVSSDELLVLAPGLLELNAARRLPGDLDVVEVPDTPVEGVDDSLDDDFDDDDDEGSAE